MTAQQRPWCLPCRELAGERHWASQNGVVCEWHWGILSPEDQAALTDALLQVHPKGGRAYRVLEQIWVVRKYLRESPNTVVETWRAEAADYLANQ